MLKDSIYVHVDFVICRDDLPKLKYLTSVIKESLRINPPVTFIQRVTDEPLVIEGYEIPKGTLMNIVIYNVLNNSTLWEDPLVS